MNDLYYIIIYPLPGCNVNWKIFIPKDFVQKLHHHTKQIKPNEEKK